MVTVQLVEDGQWVAPSWSNNPDDEQFVESGWKVVTYEGQQLFRHDQKSAAQQWLAGQGYQPTGDGAHYRK